MTDERRADLDESRYGREHGSGDASESGAPRDAERARDDARVAVERMLGTLGGITDGIVEALDEYMLADQTKEALDQGGQLVEGTILEARHQWDSPEAEELRRDAGRAAYVVGVRVRNGSNDFGSRLRERRAAVGHRMDHGGELVRERVGRANDRFGGALYTVRNRAAGVRNGAAAVRESSRRSRGAMSSISGRIGNALGASMSAIGVTVGGYAAAGVVGIVTLVLLSMGSVVGFNMLLGAPWGYFLTAGIYAVVAAFAVVGAKARAASQRKEARNELFAARRTARAVVEPLRLRNRAFSPSGQQGSPMSAPTTRGTRQNGQGRPAPRQTIHQTTIQE